MKIEKFKKLTNGQYELVLEDSSTFNIHEDLILKYNLLITKDIDEKIKKQLLEENKLYMAYNQALKYLNTKMRSINEMKEYLQKLYEDDIITPVINKLITEKYLDDKKYSFYFINDRIKLSNDGPIKIIKELQKKGIDYNFITENIQMYTTDIQEEKIKKLIIKQIKTNHNKSSIILKRKILESLINLGYDKSTVIEQINHTYDFDDTQIKQKEYEKIYKKLSTKYSGYDLEQRIKKKMYEKGFR